ncbi:MAG: glycine--tRNA ligase subunit beta [Cardiobacteriaceae bacterium]|nr:glycine--tRNA ligase subunit beta [Cardiobacteriaceae bacterium]
MTKKTLLIEIGVEELPTKAVCDLTHAGRDLWASIFAERGFSFDQQNCFGSPRRLAWRFHDIDLASQKRKTSKKGPNIKAAKDKDGNWTKAALGFAASCKVAVEQLAVSKTDKGDFLSYEFEEGGESLRAVLPELFREVIAKLPIAKRMRWADFQESFVRPVNSLVILADDEIWDETEFFGVRASNISQGHRTHCPSIKIQNALTYEDDLRSAFVIASWRERRKIIAQDVARVAEQLGGSALLNEDLLDEVASITEFPVAIAGNFEEKYLSVPQEVLITTMQDNQKTFAVVDKKGKLLPHFIAVANLQSTKPESVAAGNERVIRPRFADAEFFWQQDLKHKLEDFLPGLEKVVYQEKLGSIADKSRRVGKIAEFIALKIGADTEMVKKAAELAKCDLQSEMVMEFPELQGVMGRHYALAQGLEAEIAAAIEEQYLPLGAGGKLPETLTGTVISLAEKLDTLVGGFFIGAKPTGSKDPYALRRQAIGLIRIILEKNLNLPLTEIISKSAENLAAEANIAEVREYILERLEAFYREKSIDGGVYRAVRATNCDDLCDFDARVNSLQKFLANNQAASLLASAKRIRNILKKNGEVQLAVNTDKFTETTEKNLWQSWQEIASEIQKAAANKDYFSALEKFSGISNALESFFNDVMVIAEDLELRQNRLAMLSQIQKTCAQIADLSEAEVL